MASKVVLQVVCNVFKVGVFKVSLSAVLQSQFDAKAQTEAFRKPQPLERGYEMNGETRNGVCVQTGIMSL